MNAGFKYKKRIKSSAASRGSGNLETVGGSKTRSVIHISKNSSDDRGPFSPKDATTYRLSLASSLSLHSSAANSPFIKWDCYSTDIPRPEWADTHRPTPWALACP